MSQVADTQAAHRLSGIGAVLAKCSTTSGGTLIAGVPHLGHIGIMLIISFSANVSVHPRRTLCAVVVERLVGPDFFIFRSEREGEGRKWAENAQNRPVRAVRGHFWPIFHHFSVLEPSRGHFCITFLLNWVPRSFPRRCVIPRAEFSFLRSNVRGQRTRHLVEGTLDPLVRLRYSHLIVEVASF